MITMEWHYCSKYAILGNKGCHHTEGLLYDHFTYNLAVTQTENTILAIEGTHVSPCAL